MLEQVRPDIATLFQLMLENKPEGDSRLRRDYACLGTRGSRGDIGVYGDI